MTQKTLINCWPLLLGMAIVGICTGMQTSLLGLRANLEGFTPLTTGLIMSAYFSGFLFGAIRAPIIIKRVGHIRTFGALASMASVTILLHAIFVNQWLWMGMRFISGFAFSVIYVVAESWLNDKADNTNRGILMSIYMSLLFGGVGVGQFLLNFGSPDSFELFSIVSVLISIAVIPMLVTVTSAPAPMKPAKMNIRILTKTAPLGLVCAFLSQCCYSAMFGLGPVWMARQGSEISEIALFMATFIFGGLIVQLQIGKWSDRLDRRLILALLSGFSVIMALILGIESDADKLHRYIYIGLLGAFLLPLYSQGIAHTHDFLEREQMIGASSVLIRTGGAGAIVGPLLIAYAMQHYGNEFFFYTMALMPLLICLYSVYRMTRRPQAVNQQGDFDMIAPTQTSDAVLSEMARTQDESASEEMSDDLELTEHKKSTD